jgi:parallel beta-helix repeat protein
MASGNPTVVDAGPAKTLIFPATDLTLFGHATDPENDPLTIQWTQTSGPAGVSFSAPNAAMTTVSFTKTGTYTFQLSAYDGTSLVTSSATVTVKLASSQTAFYVDPTYTGSTQNGSASAPWKSLLNSDSDYTSKWSTITTALASNDVIIYFSARQAGSDTIEQIVPPKGGRMFVNRGCRGGTFNCPSGDTTGSHRLTLDGMSMYNTNDATPSWASYAGANKFKINCSNTCGSMSIGWDDDNQRDYITIRGFEVTGPGARVRWGGNYSYLERMWVHDVTTVGATVQFMSYVQDGTCNPIGIDHDVTVRNNMIERGIGEGLYVASNYNLAADGGCVSGPNSGDGHYDILIEGNTIREPGLNGDQGDGIDIKAGICNVTVRGNTITNTHAGTPPACSGGDGITTLGRMPNSTHESNYLIERNVISHGGCAITGSTDSSKGIAIGALWGATVRNNVINTFPGEGIVAWTRDVSTPKNQRIRIYNNTIYNATLGGIAFSDFIDGPVLRNNLIFNNGGATIDGTVPSINSDYNLLSPTKSNLAEGSHTIVRTSGSGIVVNASGGDFHLTATSPAVNVAISLSTLANLAVGTTAFTADIANVARPQGGAWEIGAYEFPSGSAAYTISGTENDGGGVGISGVTVALTDTSGANYTTGADGAYSFSGSVTGNYTVTPSKSGYTFTHANRSYTSLAANQTGQDFVGTPSGWW